MEKNLYLLSIGSDSSPLGNVWQKRLKKYFQRRRELFLLTKAHSSLDYKIHFCASLCQQWRLRFVASLFRSSLKAGTFPDSDRSTIQFVLLMHQLLSSSKNCPFLDTPRKLCKFLNEAIFFVAELELHP